MRRFTRPVQRLPLCTLVLCTLVLLAGCDSWPWSRPQSPPAADTSAGDTAGSTGRGEGTSLGQVGSRNSVSGSEQTPSALNAKPGQVPQAAQAQAGVCADLRGQIRSAQADERAAPTTSTDEDIVNASLAKADQRIADLQQQYEQLGCSDAELPSSHVRAPVVPPAPGGPP